MVTSLHVFQHHIKWDSFVGFGLPHLLQRQYELGDALLAAETGQQLVGVHTLAVSSLHQFGDDPLNLLLLRHSPEQLIVEDLTIRQEQKR